MPKSHPDASLIAFLLTAISVTPSMASDTATASPGPAAGASTWEYRAADPAPKPKAPEAELSAADSPEAAVNEAMRARNQVQKAYQALNVSNPTADDFGKVSAASTGPGTEALRKVQALLSHPQVQHYAKAISDPVIVKAIGDVLHHPNRMQLLYAEIGLVLFILVFRAWRMSKTRHWSRRLWVNGYTFAMYWALSVIIVPSLMIGVPYRLLLARFWSALTAG